MKRDLAREMLEANRAVEVERLRGAILHELRRSGPLGLSPLELSERIGHTAGYIADVSDVLTVEGVARWNETRTLLRVCEVGR